MRTLLTKAVLLAAALALSGAAQAGETIPTPGIARIDELDIPGAAAWAMKGALGDSGITVGLAAVCATEGPRRVEATAFFGGFPGDRRPVQSRCALPKGRSSASARSSPAVRNRASTARASAILSRPHAWPAPPFGWDRWSRTATAHSGTGRARRATARCSRRSSRASGAGRRAMVRAAAGRVPPAVTANVDGRANT